MSWAVTVPDTLEMIVGERLNLVVNFTNLIAPGDVLSLPVATVKSTTVNELVPSAIIGVPFILPGSGGPLGTNRNMTLNVTISSSPLRVKTDYVLTLSAVATGGAGVKNVSALLIIRVIY